MSRVFDEMAEAADDVADDQREVARRARSMGRKHDRGVSLGAIFDSEEPPVLIDRLRRSAKRLAEATSRFAQAAAEGLSREGESHRSIGKRLRVSHQRIGKLLKGEARDDRSAT